MDLSFLPLLNAILNGLCAVLLTTGWFFVKSGNTDAHRKTMISAFAMSSLFLACYVLHKVWKATTGLGLHTNYNGVGGMKTLYLSILLTHLLLAITVPVFAIIMIRLGLKGKNELHKRIGKIALPIWMYVSVTGVIIYLMLYPFNPAA